MSLFRTHISRHKLLFILAPLLTLCGAVGEVLLPRMIADLINHGIAASDMAYVRRQGLAMLGLVALLVLLSVLGALCAAKVSVLFSSGIRRDVFAKIQEFSFANIDSFHTGSLVTRLTNDVAQIQQFTMQMLRMGIRSPAHLLGALVMAFSINVRLALVILVVTPVLAVLIAVIIRAALPRFARMQSRIDQVNALLQEAMTNVRVIKSFVRGDYEKARFDSANLELQEASLDANRIMLLQRPTMTLAMDLTTVAVVWFGGSLIIGGRMPVGDLTAFITYVTQILTSLNMLSNILVTSSRAIVSANRISEIVETKVDLNDDYAARKELAVSQGSVEFRDVSFRYYKRSRNPVLSHVSFSIAPGQTVGLLGSTGSGKTTLTQMIPRLLDPDQGSILVDGVDVRDYSLQNLRGGVAMVLQNNLLFSGSIAENLAWGSEHATPEEMARAAEYAQIHQFISDLPDGYDTELEQGGVNLSGGQKQRLCIARALLKSPKILILDDSTSAVDTATEARIRRHLADSLPDTTKIIIAQRVTSVIDADKILVLNDGMLVGEGSHRELLASNTVYREIYYSQVKKEEAMA